MVLGSTTSCPLGGGQLFDVHKLPSSPLQTGLGGSASLHLIDTTQNGQGTLNNPLHKVLFCMCTREP